MVHCRPLRKPVDDVLSLPTTVVLAVAEATDRPPEALPPLDECVDSDALEALAATGACELVVSFVYQGVDVTVRPDVVEVRRLEA